MGWLHRARRSAGSRLLAEQGAHGCRAPGPKGRLSSKPRAALELVLRADPDRSRLVRQVPHARAAIALVVECEMCVRVPEIVEVGRHFPTVGPDSRPQIA